MKGLSLPTRPRMLRPLEIFKLVWLVGCPEMKKYGTRDPAPPPGVGVRVAYGSYGEQTQSKQSAFNLRKPGERLSRHFDASLAVNRIKNRIHSFMHKN